MISGRVCPENAFCQMRVTIWGRFVTKDAA